MELKNYEDLTNNCLNDLLDEKLREIERIGGDLFQIVQIDQDEGDFMGNQIIELNRERLKLGQEMGKAKRRIEVLEEMTGLE